MDKEKILVVDDEEHIVELIKFNLESQGYNVIEAYDGVTAVKLAKENRPNLILLDLMLPGKDGFEVCREIKSEKKLKNTSIIMLTAKGEEIDKIVGLELGADDYITKPFSVRELLARVKAVLRRTKEFSEKQSEEDIYECKGLKVNFDRHEVLVNSKKVDLSLKEFELLEILIRNEGRILKREVLLDKIWGYEYVGETRTIDVHIRYLRKKIEEDNKSPKYIETIRGVGYRFNQQNKYEE